MADFPKLATPKDKSLREEMTFYVQDLQREIVLRLSQLDQSPFVVDTWTRPSGGYGTSCILQDGNVFEKAGVNTSVIHGTLPPSALMQMRDRHTEIDTSKPLPFFATGISLVLHPRNPHAPTVHLNYRYFEIVNSDGKIISWFGGGSDLTPSILYEEDAVHFHRKLKNVCDEYGKYEQYKAWCDAYFYIAHRGERRGVGGIFFDDLKASSTAFEFVKKCGKEFLPSYMPIIEKRIKQSYTAKEKQWQQIRRGRYTEFNLVYDRGTKFGLVTPNARIESILMSLPLTARWEYNHLPEVNSKEAKLVEALRKPKKWV